MRKQKKYNPAKFNPSKGGHAQGHLRHIFEEIAELLEQDKEVHLNTKLGDSGDVNPYTVGEIIGLLWNCTDILPGSIYDILLTADLDFQSKTYGAAARAMKRFLEEAG